MATPWDIPPTPEEARAAGWDAPPTAAEMGNNPNQYVSQARAAQLGFESGATLGGSTVLRGVAGADPLKALAGGRFDRTPGPRELARVYPGVPYPEAASRWFNENRPDLAAVGAADQVRKGQRGRYLVSRDAARAESDAAFDQHPWTYGLSGLAGGAATLPLAGPGAAAKGIPLLVRMGRGAKAGAKVGAAAGLIGSRSDTLGGEVVDAGIGSAFGTTIGGAAPAVAQGVKTVAVPAYRTATEWLLRAITPKVTPTASAARLTAQGIPLTTGQMDPTSFVNTVEQTALKGPVNVDAARNEAETAARALVLRQAMEPGKALPPGTIPEQLAAIQSGFDAQYGPISATPIDPVAVATMPQRLTTGRGYIPDSVRAQAAAEVQDALTVLPARISDALPENRVPKVIGLSQAGTGAQVPVDPYVVPTPPVTSPSAIPDYFRGVTRGSITQPVELPNQGLIGGAPRLQPGTSTPAAGSGWTPVIADPPPMPSVDAGDLQAVRSIIRAQLRKSVNDPKMFSALSAAEEEITRTLSGELPLGQARALQEIDGRYAILKLLEDASARSGLQGNFTWPQLGAAIKANEGKLNFGANGGLLRQLATDAEVTFRPNIPQTGMMGRIVSNLPWMDYAVGPLSRAAQHPAVRSSMIGQPIPWGAPSPAGQATGSVRGVSPQMQALIDAMRLRVGGPAPVPADEESSR